MTWTETLEDKLKDYWIALGALFFVGIAIYSNTFQAPFVFDDDRFIRFNPVIQSVDLAAIWNGYKTRFIPFLSFALNYHFGGSNVIGYHMVNIGIHVLTSFLVFLIIARTFETPRLKGSQLALNRNLIALVGALIFVSHPIQTQAVTYLSQRMASMAALFYLATLFFYVRYRLKGGIAYFLAAVACSFLAILSKQNTYTLPFALLLYDVCFLTDDKRGGEWRARVPLLFFLIPLVFAYVAFFSKAGVGSATRMLTEMPRSHYFFTEINVIRTYIRLLFFPFGQNLDYDYPVSVTLFEPQTFSTFLALLSMMLLALLGIRKHPLFSFGVLWFFLALSIESSIIPINDRIYEHRLYLPMFGFVILVVSGLWRLVKSPVRFVAAGIVIVMIFSGMTYARNSVWTDVLRLWSDVVQKSPNKNRGHYNLGNTYALRGQAKEAYRHFERALALKPDDGETLRNFGTLLAQMRYVDKAIRCFERAVLLVYEDADLYYNLGIAYHEKGDHEKELDAYRKAAQLDPDIRKRVKLGCPKLRIRV